MLTSPPFPPGQARIADAWISSSQIEDWAEFYALAVAQDFRPAHLVHGVGHGNIILPPPAAQRMGHGVAPQVEQVGALLAARGVRVHGDGR